MTKPIDEQVLDAWLEFKVRGEAAALVTLVNVDGSAPRPVGSQIAVAHSGEAVGYITGGCAEAALAAEADDAIKRNQNRLVRYGEGSPYMDVKLPCGAGIDVFIDVAAPVEAIKHVVDSLAARNTAALEFQLPSDGSNGGMRVFESDSGAQGTTNFVRHYRPRLAVDILGKGPVTAALARLASAAGFEVSVFSPEEETRAAAEPFADRVESLHRPDDLTVGRPDRWKAYTVLFHEHEWDPPILAKILSSDCFYVGALGSRRTHAARLDALEAMGVSEQDRARVHGPIGLDIMASGPEEIAVSILAEIIAESRNRNESL